MYTSVKELHIALDVALQKIQSQIYRNIQSEEKDMLLNAAVEEYITTRTGNRFDTHQVDMVGTFSRLEELSDLIHTKTVPMIHYTGLIDKYDYCTLQNNMKYIVDVQALLNINLCGGSATAPTTSRKQFIAQIPLSKITASTYNADFVITGLVNTEGTSYPGSAFSLPLLNIDSILSNYIATDGSNFQLINTILEQLNHLTLSIPKLYAHDEQLYISGYYEKYNTLYVPKTFILVIDYVTPTVLSDLQVAHDEVEFKTVAHNLKLTPFTAETMTTIATTYEVTTTISASSLSPVEVVKLDKFSDIMGNTVFMANRYKKPIAKLEDKTLKILYESYYNTKNVNITYIKRPRKYDYISGQMCEIQDNEGILRIAVKNIEAKLLNKDTTSFQVAEKESIIIN